MKYFFVLLCLLRLYSLASAQYLRGLTSSFRAGQQLELLVEHKIIANDFIQAKTVDSLSYKVRLEVVSHRDDGYAIIHWKGALHPNLFARSGFSMAHWAYPLADIQYSVSAEGQLLEILNEEELIDSLNRYYEDYFILQKLLQPLPWSKKGPSFEELAPFWQNKATFRWIIASEIQLYHAELGQQHSAGPYKADIHSFWMPSVLWADKKIEGSRSYEIDFKQEMVQLNYNSRIENEQLAHHIFYPIYKQCLNLETLYQTIEQEGPILDQKQTYYFHEGRQLPIYASLIEFLYFRGNSGQYRKELRVSVQP